MREDDVPLLYPWRPSSVTGMDVVDFKPEHSQLVYTFGGAAPVMRVRPGTALHLWSEDAFNHALTSVNDVASEVLDFRYLNPQTGPFYVEGAQPGDTLAIHVAGLTPARSWGASAAIPFFGGMTSTDRTAMLQQALPEATWIYEVDSHAGTVGFQSRFGDLRWPYRSLQCLALSESPRPAERFAPRSCRSALAGIWTRPR